MEVVEKTKQQQLKTLKVLIADDDPPTRILLRAAISQWGYSVIEAKDGEEAWGLLQQEDAPRLLILDWLMPKLDGLSLCARIKEQSKLNPYIILLTQVTGTTNIIKGLEAGANEFLSKPFNMAELRSRLSVGAKIINFEAELDERNQQLKEYINEFAQILEMIIGLSNKLDELSKSDLSSNPVIQELKKKLEAIVSNVKLFSEKQQGEGK